MKRLIVLSLKGVVMARIKPIPPFDLTKMYPGSKEIGDYIVRKRPHLDDLLKLLFEHFTVAVWSEYNKDELDEIILYLFGDHRDKLLFIWDKSKCKEIDHPLNYKTKQKRKMFSKPLKTIWGEHPEFDMTNTLMVDHNKWQHLGQPEKTQFYPDEWHFTSSLDTKLRHSDEIWTWVDLLSKSTKSLQDFICGSDSILDDGDV